MNTTITALQALYLKLGGSLTDTYDSIANGEEVGNYTTIPDMIEACAQKAGSGGGGSSLPAVTADDNSKLLTVVNGAWDKADPVDSDFVVEFTIDMSQGEPAVTADHTAAEIYTAFQQGKNIKGVAEMDAELGGKTTIVFYITYVMLESGELAGVVFYTFGMEGGLIRITGDTNSWSMDNFS